MLDSNNSFVLIVCIGFLRVRKRDAEWVVRYTRISDPMINRITKKASGSISSNVFQRGTANR